MTDERLNIWLGFAKFLLGTFALGLVSTLINSAIQERELELKEQEQIGEFLQHALDQDVGVRKRFAQYFATVTRSEVLRTRWQEYSDLVEIEFQQTQQEKQELEARAEEEGLDPMERNRLFARIAELDEALKPTPTQTRESAPPRIFLHIRSEDQREQAQVIADHLIDSAYVVPGIQRVETGPKRTELRYFRQREREEAVAIASTLRNVGLDVQVTLIGGYESSPVISPRHYELWFAEGTLTN